MAQARPAIHPQPIAPPPPPLLTGGGETTTAVVTAVDSRPPLSVTLRESKKLPVVTGKMETVDKLLAPLMDAPALLLAEPILH